MEDIEIIKYVEIIKMWKKKFESLYEIDKDRTMLLETFLGHIEQLEEMIKS